MAVIRIAHAPNTCSYVCMTLMESLSLFAKSWVWASMRQWRFALDFCASLPSKYPTNRQTDRLTGSHAGLLFGSLKNNYKGIMNHMYWVSSDVLEQVIGKWNRVFAVNAWPKANRNAQFEYYK